MNTHEAHAGEKVAGSHESDPVLPKRLLDAFFSPDRMATAVARNPRWLGAMLICGVLLALSLVLIPADILAEAQRRALIERGRNPQAMPEQAIFIMRIVTPLIALAFFALISFVLAGVYTTIFGFILGDEGTYKQYLAVSVHAAIIPVLVALLLTPLKIAQEDPQLTLNLGTLLAFVPDGFARSFLRYMDLTQIWAALVTAQGTHAIDPRRSWASAAAVLVGMNAVIALIVAAVVTRFGIG